MSYDLGPVLHAPPPPSRNVLRSDQQTVTRDKGGGGQCLTRGEGSCRSPPAVGRAVAGRNAVKKQISEVEENLFSVHVVYLSGSLL
jgi:hypothetical protein